MKEYMLFKRAELTETNKPVYEMVNEDGDSEGKFVVIPVDAFEDFEKYGDTSNCAVCGKRIVFCKDDVWLHCEPQDHGIAKAVQS